MSDYLPPLVIEAILTKLPTKCLLKCRCVCKSWYNLIKTPHFIHTHLATLTEDTNKLLLIRTLSANVDEYAFHFNNEDVNECLPRPFPFTSFAHRAKSRIRPILGYPRILDCINGLVCLYDKFNNTADWRIHPHKFGHQFILWNPCMGKYLLVPPPSIDDSVYSCGFAEHPSLVGFGFDDRCSDFKIFRIVLCRCENRCEKHALVECEVYSLNAGLWRTVTGDLPYYGVVTYDAHQAYVQGALHWIVNNGTKNLLMVFNVRDEVFSEISMPESLTDVLLYFLCVYKYESSLAIVEKLNMNVYDQSTFHIWVMKEYGKVESWMKLRVLDGLEIGIRILKVLEFRNSKQVFVESAGEDYHVVCVDFEAQKVIYVRPTGGKRHASVHAYTERLALLDKGIDIANRLM